MKTYTKAVSATLAGALAVGMVPAMALADTVDDSIELQTVDGVKAFRQGKITAATDQDGKALDLTKEVKLTLDGENEFLVIPTEVTPKLDSAVKVDDELYTVKYYSVGGGDIAGTDDGTGNPLQGTEITTDADADGKVDITVAGEYYAVVTAANTGTAETVYNGGAVAIKFTLVAPTLVGAAAYEVNAADEKDSSDKVFTYKGANFDASSFGFVDANGKIVDPSKYSVEFYYDNGSGVYGSTVTPKTVGNYAAKLVGVAPYDTTPVYIPFQINPFELGAVSGLAHSAILAGSVSPTVDDFAILDSQIPGLAISSADYELVPKTDADKIGQYTEMGTYTYILKEKAAASLTDASVAAGVNGTAEVSVDVVANALEAANFLYGKTQFAEANPGLADIDLGGVNPTLFDADLIKVEDANGKAVPFTIEVTDAKGQKADVADVNTPGTWNVTVKVNGKDNSYTYGGISDTVQIVTTAGAIDLDTSAAFKYKGQTTGSFSVEYTGSDILSQITTLVTANGGKKTLVAGTDYTVKVTNGKSAVVDKIVDADTYTLELESKTYSFSGTASITVTVNPVTVDAVILDQDTAAAATGNQIYYTGEVINPVAKFVKPGTTTEIAVDAASYKVTINSYVDPKNAPKTVKEIKEAGTYNITISDVTGGNITVNSQTVDITVTEDGPYLDVPTSKWFADEVLLAKNLNYMTGYYGSNTFGPYDSALRQDVAIVIGRMAGLTFTAGNEGSTEYDKGYESDFSDVVAGAYYAKAVQWINKSGIMTGYSANDEFGVGDEIKRQDLAVALYRYAQKYQKSFVAPKDVAGSLANYTDGAEVSGYAKTAVAWAIENGIMGKDTTALNPGDDITRAELAAMTVRLQPKALA